MTDQVQTQEVTTPAAEPQTTVIVSGQEKTEEARIPKSRLDEVIARAKAAEAKNAELEAAAKAATDARLVEEQKWQELAEQRQARIAELEPVQDQVEGYKAALEATIEQMVESLPEPARELVPDLDPVGKLAWLNKALPTLSKKAAPSLDGGARGDPVPPVTLSPEEAAIARKAGMTVEEYAKFRDM